MLLSLTAQISSRQARSIARKLNAGWKSVGLKEADCVCMLSFNDVSTIRLQRYSIFKNHNI